MPRGYGPTLPTIMETIRQRKADPEFGGHEQDEEEYDSEGGEDDDGQPNTTPTDKGYWSMTQQNAVKNMMSAIKDGNHVRLASAMNQHHEATNRLADFEDDELAGAGDPEPGTEFGGRAPRG